MANASSIIRVSIIGDAQKLINATKDANSATGGLLSSTAKIAGGFFIAQRGIDAAFDSIQGGLEKADILSDSLETIAGTVSPEFAKRIEGVAFSMTNVGLSADEVGTLAANFGNLATAAQVSEPVLTNLTPKMLELAAAIAAQTGKTADEVITDIGKAAQGSQKPVSEYGVVVDNALNPDALILSIFDQLQAKYPDAISATSDLAGKQENLNAKWDNFTILVGGALEGPLEGVLDFFITMIERDIPRSITDLQNLAGAFESFGRAALGPLGNVRDALEDLAGLIGDVGFNLTHIGQNVTQSELQTQQAIDRRNARNGQGSP